MLQEIEVKNKKAFTKCKTILLYYIKYMGSVVYL